MLGKKVRIENHVHHLKQEKAIVEGIVIFENESFITVQARHYATSVSKHDLRIGDAKIL